MASFVTLEQVKDILWICDSTDDARLEAILASVLDSVFTKVWNIVKGEKTELILKTQRLLKDDILPLSCINPTLLKSIDWVSFTAKTEGSDYLLLENGTVQVPDLRSYFTTDFDYVKVVYEAWYEKAPLDFVKIIAWLVWIEFWKDNSREIIEETTWPRTVRYSDASWGSWVDSETKKLYAKLAKYIPVHLRVY